MNLIPTPLDVEAFAPFGHIVETTGTPDFEFNEGRADRWQNCLIPDMDAPENSGISLCISRPIVFPYALKMVERHPLGSQAFIPLNEKPFLVIVAHDLDGVPDVPQVFVTNGMQGINFARNTWHGVLSPIDAPQRFLMVDRCATEGVNLQVHDFSEPFTIDEFRN